MSRLLNLEPQPAQPQLGTPVAAARAPCSPPSAPSAPSPGVGLVLAGSSADAQGHSFSRIEVGALSPASRVDLDAPCWSWSTALVQKGRAVSSHALPVLILDVVPSCCCFCPLKSSPGQRPSQTASRAHRVPPSPFVVPSRMREEPPGSGCSSCLHSTFLGCYQEGARRLSPPWPPLVWPAAAGLRCAAQALQCLQLRQEGMTDRD